MKEQNDSLKESLSALMDNEASELELRRVLKAIEQGDSEQASSLKASWHRYHIVRTLFDEQSRTAASSDFLSGIHSEIESSTPDFPAGLPKAKSESSSGLFKVAGQGLLAASVAVLAITFSLNLLQDQDGAQGFDLAAESGSVTGVQNLTAQNNEAGINYTSELDPEAVEQLRRAVNRSIGIEDESFQVPVSFRIEDFQD